MLDLIWVTYDNNNIFSQKNTVTFNKNQETEKQKEDKPLEENFHSWLF